MWRESSGACHVILKVLKVFKRKPDVLRITQYREMRRFLGSTDGAPKAKENRGQAKTHGMVRHDIGRIASLVSSHPLCIMFLPHGELCNQSPRKPGNSESLLRLYVRKGAHGATPESSRIAAILSPSPPLFPSVHHSDYAYSTRSPAFPVSQYKNYQTYIIYSNLEEISGG